MSKPHQSTVMSYLTLRNEEHPDNIWLRERKGNQFAEWSWRDAHAEINAAAAWLEQHYGASQANMALLSRNRAHWMMADLAIIASGNVSIPMFTTFSAPAAEYILDFTNTRVLILGEADNWSKVRAIVPGTLDIVTLPGVDIDEAHTRWDDIVAECAGQRPQFEASHDDLASIIFTSGTTGVPKGVMHSHDTHVIPMQRTKKYFGLRARPKFLSYLPLAHVAERDLVLMQSLLYEGTVTFNESLETLLRDMAETKPNFFFGAPRVWEQLQQGLLSRFGSQEALNAALANDREGVGLQVRTSLGLDEADYLLTGAAPTPPALILWYEDLGLQLMEGYGQTELMPIALNNRRYRKVGSIGRLVDGLEMKIADDGELLFKARGSATGYFGMPDKSAETFVDGWVHTGDKGYEDDDGFIYLTGRVKDYFKTIQGKYVAPVPLENDFAKSELIEQLCLLGRGYSKTVVVCVLSDAGEQQSNNVVEDALRAHAIEVNKKADKHARIGGVIVTSEPWTIDNAMLTPTLKLRRDEVEGRFGERARELAHDAAVKGEILIEWLK